jgi:hypothetical protein
MCPSKVNNSVIKDLNDNEVDEISNIELKRTMIRVINKIREDMCKDPNEFKQDINKQLNELKENSNKQLNEIRKTMQDVQEEFNKDTEILKKIKLKSSR